MKRIGIIVFILSLCFSISAFAEITIESYSKSGDPIISSDPNYYDVYIVELTVDGLPIQRGIPSHKAETFGVWDEIKAQAYFDVMEKEIKEDALNRYKLKEPELDKIVHPHFTIQYNDETGKVEIITPNKTVVIDDLINVSPGGP